MQRKRRCDGEFPCARCCSDNRQCFYHLADPPEVIRENTKASTCRISNSAHVSMSFLKSFTDLSIAGPRASFISEALESDLQRTSATKPALPELNCSTDNEEFSVPHLESSHVLFHGLPDVYAADRDCSASQKSEDSFLQARMDSIICHLKETHTKMMTFPRCSEAYFDEELARSVFTAGNLRVFSWAYFQRLHPGQPIVHVPTFEMEKAASQLLLVIFLSGSFFSAPSDDAVSAGRFSDIAEEYIFAHPILQPCSAPTDSQEDIQILAAALMIQLGQMHSDSAMTRYRSRTRRHDCLIAAIKASGILAFQHKFPLRNATASDWKKFAVSESRIRYVCVCAFAPKSSSA